MPEIKFKGEDGNEDSIYGEYDEKTRTATSASGRKIQAGRNDRVEVSACFIATEVYGGIDEPQVRILREYRDKVIIPKGGLGKAFVSFYYKVGPYLARFVKRFPKLRPISRSVLDAIVRKCEKKL